MKKRRSLSCSGNCRSIGRRNSHSASGLTCRCCNRELEAGATRGGGRHAGPLSRPRSSKICSGLGPRAANHRFGLRHALIEATIGEESFPIANNSRYGRWCWPSREQVLPSRLLQHGRVGGTGRTTGSVDQFRARSDWGLSPHCATCSRGGWPLGRHFRAAFGARVRRTAVFCLLGRRHLWRL